jgi:hypothetical protein
MTLVQHEVTLIFQQIEKKEAFKRMFFKKLSETENPNPWFDELYKRNYLDPSNNKKVTFEGNNYTVPYWHALGYLENLARHLAKKPDEVLIQKLLNLLDVIIDYKKNGKRIENPHTDWMVIKIIFKLPVERITEKHVQFIETAYFSKFNNSVLISSEIEQNILPLLIHEKSKKLILALLKIIIKPRVSKETSSFFEVSSVMDEWWFSEAMKKHRGEIAKICGLDAARIVIDQMSSILKDEEEDRAHAFNIVSVPTIEDDPQTMFPEKYECQLVYLLRDILDLAEPPSQASLLNELLQNRFSIFRRIAIHVISYHYCSFSSLFWSWKNNPLEEFGLKHEIYELLCSNKQSFSQAEFDKLIDWIEKIEVKSSGNALENLDLYRKQTACAKLEWLSAVADTANEKIKGLEHKYSQICPEKIEHPGYIFWSSGIQVSVGGSGKLLSDEILKRSNQEIAEYIINYKEPAQRDPFETDKLEYSISRSVRENPKKFVADMNPFLRLKPIYQEALLSGVLDGWKNNEQFSWDNLFDYISALISDDDFWLQSEKSEILPKKWLISKIADLIYEGTNDDKHAFDPKNLPECEKILLKLSENTASDVDESTKDVFSAVLNSTLGRVYYAMISYSLRFARLYRKNKDQRWPPQIKAYFEKILNTERPIEFDVILGTFALQLLYLDKTWFKENINKIFDKENKLRWAVGFSSYLFHSSQFSQELYLLLRTNEHYCLAMRTKLVDSHTTAKVSQHIFIAYLNDVEPLSEDSLISELISNKDVEYLSNLVWFGWRLRNSLDERKKAKIKPLWGKIILFITESGEEAKYRDVLAHLSFWLSLVDQIDEDICNWLVLSGKYVDVKIEIIYMEYLSHHVSKTPNFVAEIFYELIKSERYFPQYKTENIVDIVRKLFQLGQSEKAKRICNLYLNNGYQFLRDVYEEYKES